MVRQSVSLLPVSSVVLCVSLFATTTAALASGSVAGDRHSRTSGLYFAGPDAATSPEPILEAATQASPVESQPDVDLERLRASIRPRHLLRIQGTFGQAVGRIDSFNTAGLHGLHPHPRHDPGLGPVPDPIPWSSITRIDRRGNSAGAGAVIGGLALALFSGISVGAFDETGASGLEGGLVFLSLFGGAASGGLIGALIPSWHKVLPPPEPPQRRLEQPRSRRRS